MSEDEQRLTNSKLIHKYLASKGKLVAMRSDAARVAGLLKNVANHILQSLPARYHTVFTKVDEMPKPDHLKQLLTELASESDALSDFESKMTELGLPFQPIAARKIAQDS